MRSKWLVTSAIALVLSTRSSAAQLIDPSQSLKDLPGVLVMVNDLNPQIGITQDQMVHDIEQWLQQAGIARLDRDKFPSIDGHPTLYVHVAALEPRDEELKGVLFFTIRIGLYQDVSAVGVQPLLDQ